MFTDIRMPKMDGIELVHLANSLEKPPLIVAISGYDDFSYAVEMLRSGVREYILKPVERDKITDILKKLNEEIEGRNLKSQKDKDFGLKEVRQLVERPSLPEERIGEIAERYGEIFFGGPYKVYVAVKGTFKDETEGIVFPEVYDSDVLVAETASEYDADKLSDVCVGVSGEHTGLAELRAAYMEALKRRKNAFVTGTCCDSDEGIKEAPEALKTQARRLLEEASLMQRLQLVGTKREDELDEQWGKLFTETRRGNLSYDEFEIAVKDFCVFPTHILWNTLKQQWKDLQDLLRSFARNREDNAYSTT